MLRLSSHLMKCWKLSKCFQERECSFVNQRYKYLLKNTGLLTISNFASKVLVFLLVPLYTSVLSTEEYGIYDLIVSTVSLLYPLLTLNIVDAVMRFTMDKDVDKKQVAYIGIRYVGISVLVIAMGLIPCHFLRIFESIHGLEIMILLYYVSYVMNQYFIQLAKGLEKVSCMAVAGIIGTVVMLGGNILFLLVFHWQLKGFMLANILAQAIPALYFFIKLHFLRFIKDMKLDKGLGKEMLQYCFPLIFSTIGWWINSASDRYAVSYLVGIGANGILSVAYKIPSILNVFVGMFGQAWLISAIKEYGEKQSGEFYAESFTFINMIMCLGCSALIFLSKPLASILYAKDFYVAWQYAPFLIVSAVFNTASGLLGPILSAKKDSKAMARSAIYGAVINIILNIVLIIWIGVQGATLATAVSAFVIYYVRKRAVGDGIKIEKEYKIMLMWILLCIQSLLEIYTKLWPAEMIIFFIIIVLNYAIIHKFIYSVYLMLFTKHSQGK